MWRKLTAPEKVLLRHMLSRAHAAEALLERLESLRVTGMDDGGMGSLRVEASGVEQGYFGETIAEAEFIDEDGVAVLVALNLDQKGRFYELDVWKVDFSRLKRWPRPEEIIHTRWPQG